MAIYGIDLGTTNSLIGLGDKLFGSATDDYLTPSIVDLKTHTVGKSLRASIDAVRSFKTSISLGRSGIQSVIASRYVLEELKRQVTDDVVKDVVISVPAYFRDPERQATIRAAEMAGLNVKCLINEPTAAAMYCLREKRRLAVIYDLGGGTFDVTVLDTRLDTYDVQATDGGKLGGDNLDEAISKYLIKKGNIRVIDCTPEMLQRLKLYAKELKHQISNTRQDVTTNLKQFKGQDVVFTVDAYKELINLVFGDTVSRTLNIIYNEIPFGEEYDLLFVGGSTRCPFLREYVESKLGKKAVPMDYNPDQAVGQGVAFYAKLLEEGQIDLIVSDVTDQLGIGLEDGTIRRVIQKNSKIPIKEKTIACNATESDSLHVTFYQGESVSTEHSTCIGELIYPYGRVVPAGEGEVSISIEVTKSGTIIFECKEWDTEPVVLKLDRGKI